MIKTSFGIQNSGKAIFVFHVSMNDNWQRENSLPGYIIKEIVA